MPSRRKRSIVILDRKYPAEGELISVINEIPKGERGKLLRALMVKGFDEQEGEFSSQGKASLGESDLDQEDK